MLDIRLFREDPERIKAGARKKRFPRDEEVDRIIALDGEIRSILPELEGLRAEQKRAGKAMGKASPEERTALIEKQKDLKVRIKEMEARRKSLEQELESLLLMIPNPPEPEVPEGEGEEDNKEVRRWGELPSFSFEPKDHVELGEMHDLMDFQRAGRIAGSRNYFLKGKAVLLEEAILRFALDHMVKKGFTPLVVPLLVRDEAMRGTGYYPGGEEQAYRVEKDGLSLVGTAEVPLTAYHGGEILSEEDLPVRLVARSYCFRREAGTYGKDTRGLYRVHQFQKVEQVIVDRADEERSKAHQEEILRNAEEVLQALGLPYRVVDVCGGELGMGQVRKFDLETWMPSRGNYGETHSASRFHEFQARRLNLRYRDEEGKVRFCHTLNNTVVASPRILIPFLENLQREDGSIPVPECLHPYLDFTEIR